MTGWLRGRTWAVWAAIGVLAAADSVGVALVAVHTAPAPALVAQATTTTSPFSSSTTLAPSDTTSTLAALTTTTAVRKRATTTTGPANAGGVAAPRPGTYHYHVATHSDSGGDVEDDAYAEDLNVVDLGNGRQRHRSLDDGEIDHVDEVVWRADGRFVAVTRESDTPGSTDCDWEPDLKTLVFPATPGTTWDIKSSCTIADPDIPEPQHIDFTGTARITGTDKSTVGTTTVDVVKIHFDFSDPDSGDTELVDETFAPSLGLTIEEVDTSTGTDVDDNGNDVPYKETDTRRIQNLQPA